MTNTKKYKVVINDCYGGFCLSKAATVWLAERGIFLKYQNLEFLEDIPRHEPLLVQCVETLGGAANGMCADLRIVEIETPAYLISSYDGQESVITPQSDFICIPENA